MLKLEDTHQVKSVNTPKIASESIATRSSTPIDSSASGLVKITTLIADRKRNVALMMVGLSVLLGIASCPTANVDTVAVAAESRATVVKAGSASTLSVTQLHTAVATMQTKYGKKSTVLVAQSIPVRYVNPANPNSSQFAAGSTVTIDVSSPKTRVLKPVATGQAAFNQGGYADDLNDSDDRLPSTQPTRTMVGFSWPAAGKLTSRFGRRWGRMHKGIDIAGPVGTPVNAAADGTVIYAGWHSGGYGNLVEVKHSDGTTTRYGHNSRVSVSVGQTIRQGQQLAGMGSTGNSSGSHLHFEIRPAGGRAINPIALLPANS